MALIDNILAYYKFDNNSNDSVGSNNGTDSNITYVTGKILQGAEYNASNSDISLSPVSLSAANTFTIAGWIKLDTNNAYRVLYKSGTASNFWVIYIQNTGKLDFTVDNIAEYPGDTVLSTGTWYHVAIVVNGGSMMPYVNGVADRASAYTLAANVMPSGTARFGQYGSNSYVFDGITDEFGLWDRALSGAEITSLYNGGTGISYPFASSTSHIKSWNGITN